MSVFISAGHNPKGKKIDVGAIGINGIREADLTIEARNGVILAMRSFCPMAKIITDRDDETLAEYLRRIKTGSGSVVVEFHWNAFNGKAEGTETIIADKHTQDSLNFATEINNEICRVLGTKNRGVKTESDSHRGKLALVRVPAGIAILIELAFIDNAEDLQKYNNHKQELFEALAKVILKYEGLRN